MTDTFPGSSIVYGKLNARRWLQLSGSGSVTTRPIINEDGTPLDDDTASLHCDGSASIDDDDVHKKRGLKWKLMVHQIGNFDVDMNILEVVLKSWLYFLLLVYGSFVNCLPPCLT